MLPTNGDHEPLWIAVRDERRIASHIIIGEAIGQFVDGVIVPELGEIVRRRSQVELALDFPLGLSQMGGVPVERRAHRRIGRQGTGAAEDVLRGGGHAHRSRVTVEVSAIYATRREGRLAHLARRGNAERRLGLRQGIELRRHFIDKLLERGVAAFLESSQVFADGDIIPIGGMQAHG